MTPIVSEVDVTVTHGDVHESARKYLATKIREVAAAAPAPVLWAHASIRVAANPAHPRPVTMKVSLDVNGRLVRAHVAADELRETTDLLAERLRHGLEILSTRRQSRRSEPAALRPGEWRHSMVPTPRPPYFPRPVEDREVVRRKTFAVQPLTPAEAADEMMLLDHDFRLFTEQATGADAIVEISHDGEVRLTVAGQQAPQVAGLAWTANVVPTMELSEAIRALNDGGPPRLFFLDRAHGRGAVIYRRYDGHYGLVTATSGA